MCGWPASSLFKLQRVFLIRRWTGGWRHTIPHKLARKNWTWPEGRSWKVGGALGAVLLRGQGAFVYGQNGVDLSLFPCFAC